MSALAIVLVCGCEPSGPSATETLKEFFDAVQQQDLGRLRCLMAGAADAVELGATEQERRQGFEDWAGAYYDAYESGRDAGKVELDPQGLVLVKLFALGRGTFALHRQTGRPGEGAVVIESRIRFGYAHIDLSQFSPGTTFYVSGAPVGRVHALRIPAGGGEITVDALERVSVDWTLVRRQASGECAGGWAVAAAEPVESTVTTTGITWEF